MKRKYRIRTVFHDDAMNGYKKKYFIQKRITLPWFSYWITISASCFDREKVLADCKEAQELYDTQNDSI